MLVLPSRFDTRRVVAHESIGDADEAVMVVVAYFPSTQRLTVSHSTNVTTQGALDLINRGGVPALEGKLTHEDIA